MKKQLHQLFIAGFVLTGSVAVAQPTLTASGMNPVETKLFNSVGQQVQTGVSVDGIQGSNTLTLDIATLPEGIYFAQIMVDGNLAGTKRFVVTK